MRCTSITNRTSYITTCAITGINKNACLLKTSTYCRYSNGSCTSITSKAFSNITTCDSTLNWYACINVTNGNCKF